MIRIKRTTVLFSEVPPVVVQKRGASINDALHATVAAIIGETGGGNSIVCANEPVLCIVSVSPAIVRRQVSVAVIREQGGADLSVFIQIVRVIDRRRSIFGYGRAIANFVIIISDSAQR